MLKLAVAAVLAVIPLALVTPPGAFAAAGPVHTLQVSGTGVGTFPAYDAAVRRYAATTTEATFHGDASDDTTNQDASIAVDAQARRETSGDPDLHGPLRRDPCHHRHRRRRRAGHRPLTRTPRR
jgi:hypothetical protein